jgi:hypothetical protein
MNTAMAGNGFRSTIDNQQSLQAREEARGSPPANRPYLQPPVTGN